MAILLATDLTFGQIPPADDNGKIDHGKFASLEEIHELIENSEMDEGQSITALYFIEQWIRDKTAN